MNIPFPDKKYNIIYADPPWHFNFKNRKDLSEDAKSRLYETMKSEDIVNLDVNKIAADDCILFLWVMNSELPLALKCIESWGFTYKTVAFFWLKTRTSKYHFGGGNWTRSNPEQCLLATKGDIKRISAGVKNTLIAGEDQCGDEHLLIDKLGVHSKKPIIVRDRIVKLVGDLPRIELFARESAAGWDVWGDPAPENLEDKETI